MNNLEKDLKRKKVREQGVHFNTVMKSCMHDIENH